MIQANAQDKQRTSGVKINGSPAHGTEPGPLTSSSVRMVLKRHESPSKHLHTIESELGKNLLED